MRKDWAKRFRWPSVYWNEVARGDTDKMLVVHNAEGSHQLYSYDRATGESRQLSNEKGGKVFGSISSAGNWIFYLDDEGGSEVGRFVRVPFDGGPKECISPDESAYSGMFVRTSADESVYAWTGAANDVHRVYRLAVAGAGSLGRPVCLYESANFIDTPLVSASGNLICFAEEEVVHSVVHRHIKFFDQEKGDIHTVDAPSRYEDIQPIAFFGSDESTIIATCRGKEYKRPILLNLRSAAVTELSLGKMAGDVYPLFYKESSGHLLLSNDNEARQRLLLYSFSTNASKDVPLKTGSVLSWYGSAHVTKKQEIVVQWESAGHPPCIAAIDLGEKSELPASLYPKDAPSADAAWEEVRFPSESGHAIQAWMMRPSSAAGPTPFVISAHGGPHSVSLDVFAPEALMWLDAGYGYMAVNYSGSTSFGEQFMTSIRGKPGKLEALDMVAARAHLIESGLADPEKIILTGWSWGGFITLLTLGLHPKLWAAGIAGIPVADTVASYEDEAPSMKTLDHELFGGTPDEAKDTYVSSSPMSYVVDIAAPVLIIHAKNDTRCPVRQVENFIDTMKKAGKSIESHWFDSGHLGHFSNQDVAVSNFEVALRFAQKLLDVVQAVRINQDLVMDAVRPVCKTLILLVPRLP